MLKNYKDKMIRSEYPNKKLSDDADGLVSNKPIVKPTPKKKDGGLKDVD